MGGWGSKAQGNNPGAYRDANFVGAFPAGVVIGAEPGDSALFTTSKSVENFLPAGGKAGVLGEDLVDPKKTDARVLGGQVLALSLTLGFDAYDPDFNPSDSYLGNYVLVSGACADMTVQEVLAEANAFLAGHPSEFSASDLVDCTTLVNENYVDGTEDHEQLVPPVCAPEPEVAVAPERFTLAAPDDMCEEGVLVAGHEGAVILETGLPIDSTSEDLVATIRRAFTSNGDAGELRVDGAVPYEVYVNGILVGTNGISLDTIGTDEESLAASAQFIIDDELVAGENVLIIITPEPTMIRFAMRTTCGDVEESSSPIVVLSV